MTIKLASGDLVKAEREVVYAFGHWMGYADLAYCMDGGKNLCTHKHYYVTVWMIQTFEKQE